MTISIRQSENSQHAREMKFKTEATNWNRMVNDLAKFRKTRKLS
jgi:hypothetical protein